MAHHHAEHVCPPWVGAVVLLNPLRKFLHSPRSVLGPHIRGGMTVIEPGPGMGFFTLEAARLVGTGGKVIALDVQDRMIEALRKRLDRAGLVSRVELRTVEPGDLGIRRKGIADFFLAFAMVHEVPDPRRFFEQAYDLLRAGGRLLLAEPSGHISETVFARELELAVATGFKIQSRPAIRTNRAALLEKPGGRSKASATTRKTTRRVAVRKKPRGR